MINLYIKEIEKIWFGVAFESKEIFATAFAFNKQKALQSLLKSIQFNVPFQQLEKASNFAEYAVSVLKDIYDGKDVSVNLSLAINHLPNYTRRVIEATFLIPTGYVTSYGAIAKAVSGSPRAVGRVMASHPFPLVVPCHRVVRSDFTLGGYGGGYSSVDVKLGILKRESRGYASKRKISVGDKELLVFPVEFVLKRLEKGKC